MKLSDIKDYLNTLLASFSAVLDLELTILRSERPRAGDGAPPYGRTGAGKAAGKLS